MFLFMYMFPAHTMATRVGVLPHLMGDLSKMYYLDESDVFLLRLMWICGLLFNGDRK